MQPRRQEDVWTQGDRYPLQLALSVPQAHMEDPRFQETRQVLHLPLPSGSRVIIQSGPRRGRVGTVRQSEDSRNTVTVELVVEDVEPQFGLGIAAALADKYASASLAATELGVREDVLAACCGSVLARDDDRGYIYDLGLRLCIEDGAFVAPGFCRAERTTSDTRACDWSQSNDMLTHSDAPRHCSARERALSTAPRRSACCDLPQALPGSV